VLQRRAFLKVGGRKERKKEKNKKSLDLPLLFEEGPGVVGHELEGTRENPAPTTPRPASGGTRLVPILRIGTA
jgi:hypothetical protein